MFQLAARLKRFTVLLAVMLAACGGESTSPTPVAPPPPPPPPPTPTVTLATDPATATITAGSNATVTATIVRGGGFTGAVTIGGTGGPSGVTITGGTIATGATSTLVTVASTSGAAIGTANLTITGTASGVTITPATVGLTVNAALGQIGAILEGEGAGDEFGTRIALSANGSRLIVGAPFNDGGGSNAGHARVFERNGNSWVRIGADLDGAAEDRYGYGVAISDDGSRVAVGSYLGDGGGTNSGHVRVFEYAGGAWVQVGSNMYGSAGRGTGFSLAMNAAGTKVVAGGPTSGAETGEVKAWELVGGAWVQMGSALTGGSEFGHAVTMSDNGNRIGLSYPSASGSSQPGFTRIYDWNGTAWVQTGATIAGEAISDNSGVSLSLSGDGSMIAIGADNNLGSGVSGGGARGGHVRVYRLAGGAWAQVGADIDGPQALPSGGGFGQSVSLSGDGTRMISVGDGGGKESIGIYMLSGNAWTQYTGINFGTGGRMGGVAISADGKVIAIGEVYFPGAAGSASGAVRTYALP